MEIFSVACFWAERNVKISLLSSVQISNLTLTMVLYTLQEGVMQMMIKIIIIFIVPEYW